uniref:NADH-ubiquinone oxidoreductase chain 2 n=1 Tax=Parastratiosphecomyia szechuanensis TaxID=2783694 RepID=A0A7S7AA45_9DIPT|nr:NADH dehydrogenase subunit 2 [Parastratiosphecomyia szechuanensis]QOW38320.1 NADH dehydrogenase subunit 2 [Parastratiosphecomyia szechuanensis]
MFNNSSKMLFLSSLILGTMITVSSSSWISTWMGLEINMLSFIPLISNSNNLMSAETALKYFLTQAMASSIFFIAIIIYTIKNNINYSILTSMNPSLYLIIISLMIKMGIAPFHFWFPSIMEGINWINSIILMIWQKIAPLILMSYIFNMKFMLYFIITSALVGALGGLNQTSLRKLMAFSSINHMSWMLMAMQESNKMLVIYFLFYTFLSSSVIFLFYNFKLYYMNQLFNMFSQSNKLKFSFFINLLSMGGLPPFIGFLPKWMIIQNLLLTNQITMTFLLIVSSLITLFFYLRICYSTFMIGTSETNWSYFFQINKKTMNIMVLLSFMSITGMMFIMLIYLNL